MAININSFHLVKVCNSINRGCQQNSCMDKKQFNQSQNLEEDSIVSSLALDKQLSNKIRIS